MGAAKALVHIYTGEGKGKTTASIGLAVRAAGAGMKVLFVQFFKEDSAPSGEKEVLKAVGVDLVRSNCRHPLFTGARTDLEAVRASVVGTFEAAKEKLMQGGYDLAVFDEIMSAINGGWIKPEDVLDFLDTVSGPFASGVRLMIEEVCLRSGSPLVGQKASK